jgi:hypothetical protein
MAADMTALSKPTSLQEVLHQHQQVTSSSLESAGMSRKAG